MTLTLHYVRVVSFPSTSAIYTKSEIFILSNNHVDSGIWQNDKWTDRMTNKQEYNMCHLLKQDNIII